MACAARVAALLQHVAALLICGSVLAQAAARDLRGHSRVGSLPTEPLAEPLAAQADFGAAAASGAALSPPVLNLTDGLPATGYSTETVKQTLQTFTQAVDKNGHVEPYGAWVRTALFSWLIWMVLAISVSYFCYDYEVPLLDGDSKADPKETFETGHFNCCNEETTWGICICSFCCPALRWADTADLAGFMPLWSAFGLVSMVGLLNCLSHGALAWGMYQTILLLYPHVVLAWGLWGFFSTCLMLHYRQHLRRTFGLAFGNWETCISDFCFIFWCPWCAVAQEALVVKQAYEVKMRRGRPHYRFCRGQPGADWDV